MAGLVVAAAAMLAVQVLFMVVTGAPPAWLPFVALLVLVSVPTAGAMVAWLGSRITRGASEGRATLVLAALALVAGALWGALLAGGLAARLDGTDQGAGIVLGAAMVAGLTAAVGAGVGRVTAHEAADRPVLVGVLGGVVVLVALAGLLG